MISKISLYFKDIDKKIFEQLEFVNKSPVYEDFLDRLESFSDGRGKIVAMALAGGMVVLPLFVALMFWWGNSNLKESLDVKKNIAQTIHNYRSKEAVSLPLKSQRVSGALLKSKEDFLQAIRVPPDKKQRIVVEKLKYKRVSKGLGRSIVSLSFNNLTTKSLMDMMKNIVYQRKASVSRIHIEKDKVLKTLKGKIELIVYGTLRSKKDKGKDK